MPLYEYECTKCQHRFERIQKFSDPPVTECPACGGTVSQLLSAPAIHFKGSGWYVTDYAKKSSGPATTPSSPGNGKSGSAAGESSGSKTETASETKPKAENKAAEKK